MASPLFPLSPGQHRTHGWQLPHDYRFAAKDALAPLLIGELHAALPFYALAFARWPEGGPCLVAVQGLHPGRNLFLSPAGKWQVGYIPNIYRGYPFALARLDHDEQNRMVLCFDRSSDLYRENPDAAKGEAGFFDDQGSTQPMLGKISEFLTVSAGNRELTNRAVSALETAGLLQPWQLSFANPDPEQPLLQGLLRINEGALNALDGQVLQTLREANALVVAYAQLLSMARIGVLRKLYDLRARASAQSTVAAMESIDALFGEAPEDVQKFDWSKL